MLNAKEKLKKQVQLSLIYKILIIIDSDIDHYEYLAKEYSKFDLTIAKRYREMVDILREYKEGAEHDFDLIQNLIF